MSAEKKKNRVALVIDREKGTGKKREPAVSLGASKERGRGGRLVGGARSFRRRGKKTGS